MINSGFLHDNQTFLSGLVLLGLVFRGFCVFVVMPLLLHLKMLEEVSVSTCCIVVSAFCGLFFELTVGLF